MKNLSELIKSPSAKSPAFFFPKGSYAALTPEMVSELKKLCMAEQKVVRICMHPDETSDMHNMIIAHPKDWYVRPHASLTKTKAYHALEGRMLMVGFDAEQNEIFRVVLSPEEISVFRLEKGVFLFLWALTDVCVFQETALGPFRRDEDTVFADYTPLPEDSEEVKAYIGRILA